MATRKKAKAKSKVKRRGAPAAKPVVRRKTAAPKKAAPAAKKPAKKLPKRPAKKPQVQRAAPAQAKPAPAPKPAPKPAPASAPQPAQAAPPGERVGVVTHYYGHLSVAVVRLEAGRLRVGDRIHIRGHTSDFTQRVESLQVEHQPVTEVGPNDDFALKVVEHAREHDVVYKLAP